MSEGRTAGIPDGGAQPPIIDTKFNPLGDRSKVETETTEKKEPDSESSNGADANENDENDNSRKSTHTPEQVAQWVKYQEEVKNYMIRYAAYHVCLFYLFGKSNKSDHQQTKTGWTAGTKER